VSEEGIICRCEELTREDIVTAIRKGARTVSAVKRRTGAGMGLCQGKTCQRLISQILGEEAGVRPQEAGMSRCRHPVRPLPISDIGGTVK